MRRVFSQPRAEISSLHCGRRQGHLASKLKASEAIALVIEEEESMILPDWAADCPTEIVFLLIILGATKRVYQNSGGVEYGVLVVFKKRPVKIIGPRFVTEISNAAARLAVFG